MIQLQKEFNQLPIYKNDLYLELESAIFQNNFSLNKIAFPIIPEHHQNLRHITRVSFQLSNMCNYSIVHKKCPLNQQKKKEILSSEVVFSVLDQLSDLAFEGMFAFHIYNEPMIDPRLFWFIEYAHRKCPDAIINILTNGFMINQKMIKELEKVGVGILQISAYTANEYERFVKLKANIPYKVQAIRLDNREDMYEIEPLDLSKTCSAPLNEICITPLAEIMICCLDWQQMHTFGSLEKDSFLDLIGSEDISQVFIELSQGQRSLHLCRRCSWSR